jgi:hypothetical protein
MNDTIHGTTRMSFENWRTAVDREVGRRLGLGLDDLPDVCLMDWYEDGVTVKGAAGRAIRYARGLDCE